MAQSPAAHDVNAGPCFDFEDLAALRDQYEGAHRPRGRAARAGRAPRAGRAGPAAADPAGGPAAGLRAGRRDAAGGRRPRRRAAAPRPGPGRAAPPVLAPPPSPRRRPRTAGPRHGPGSARAPAPPRAPPVGPPGRPAGDMAAPPAPAPPPRRRRRRRRRRRPRCARSCGACGWGTLTRRRPGPVIPRAGRRPRRRSSGRGMSRRGTHGATPTSARSTRARGRPARPGSPGSVVVVDYDPAPASAKLRPPGLAASPGARRPMAPGRRGGSAAAALTSPARVGRSLARVTRGASKVGSWSRTRPPGSARTRPTGVSSSGASPRRGGVGQRQHRAEQPPSPLSSGLRWKRPSRGRGRRTAPPARWRRGQGGPDYRGLGRGLGGDVGDAVGPPAARRSTTTSSVEARPSRPAACQQAAVPPTLTASR